MSIGLGMPSKAVIKQPNGKYILMHWDGTFEYNLTLEDIGNRVKEYVINMCSNEENLDSMSVLLSSEKSLFTDEIAAEIGCHGTIKDMKLYVPLKVVHKDYSPIDCQTVGKCPTCKSHVRNGLGGKDIQCPTCGQALDWSYV